MNHFKLVCLCGIITSLSVGMVTAQSSPSKFVNDSNYVQIINKRAAKIVAELELNDPKKFQSIKDLVANQYLQLNSVYAARDTAVNQTKRSFTGSRAALDSQLNVIKESINPDVRELHVAYVTKLNTLLTPAQVDQIKDGMTYGVVKVTYSSYLDMIPSLKEEEKKQIFDWLIEAREYAMDAESSEKKHGWFGKYKGKINNYLSARGYDSQKEREEWMKRLKARENAKGN